jgi:heme oxygenase
MYLLHHALEKALRHAAVQDEAIAKVVHEYQYQVPYLLEDFQFFGIDPAGIEPLPATQRFLTLVEQGKGDPMLLLGLHYVLEGSNNGGRYIARHVAEAYDLAPGPGLRYLDPYGDRQREYWQAFRTDMGSVAFTESDTARLVDAAKQMYQTVAELSEDLATAT